MSRRLVVLSVISLGFTFVFASSSRAEVVVQNGPLSTQGDFYFHGKKDKVAKIRRSLSGVACPVVQKDGQHVCLAAFDEGVEARMITLSPSSYQATKDPIVLTSGKEMDSEAVAADGKYYWVTGSHSMKRREKDGTCELNETSRHVVRIGYDPATGYPLRDGDGKLTDFYDGFQVSALLNDFLADSMGKCLGAPQHGFDIEGLATYKDKLYFGLRGPTTEDGADGATAYIVQGDPNAPAKSDPFKVRVATGHAIRDLAAVEDGILLLIGPNDDKREKNAPPGTWSIALWAVDEEADRKAPVQTLDLGELKVWAKRLDGCDVEVKPEGMAVLGSRTEENQETYQLAIFSDGMCDGGPVIVTASRPK